MSRKRWTVKIDQNRSLTVVQIPTVLGAADILKEFGVEEELCEVEERGR